jgi:hypothetical protein
MDRTTWIGGSSYQYIDRALLPVRNLKELLCRRKTLTYCESTLKRLAISTRARTTFCSNSVPTVNTIILTEYLSINKTYYVVQIVFQFVTMLLAPMRAPALGEKARRQKTHFRIPKCSPLMLQMGPSEGSRKAKILVATRQSYWYLSTLLPTRVRIPKHCEGKQARLGRFPACWLDSESDCISP